MTDLDQDSDIYLADGLDAIIALAMCDDIRKRLKQQLAAAKKALEWYKNTKRWEKRWDMKMNFRGSEIEVDRGQVARDAFEYIEKMENG